MTDDARFSTVIGRYHLNEVYCSMHKVLLGIGGNVGDVSSGIETAKTMLCQCIAQLRISHLYETEPHFDKPGSTVASVPNYINAALSGFTHLSPSQLLISIQNIENVLGRTRSIPCAPRTLDIDVLLYNDAIIDTPELTVPHPRMHLRNFVLVPACDIESDWIHPIFGKTLAQLLASCPDALALKPYRR